MVTLCGGVIGAAVAIATPKTYQATSSLVVRWTDNDASTATYTHAQYATNVAKTYVVLIAQEVVLQGTIDALDLSLTPSQLRARLSVDHPVDSQLIQVSATSQSPQEAQAIATEVARQMSGEIVREEGRGPFRPAQVDALVAVEAPLPKVPVAPRPAIYVMVGLLLGAVVALGYATIKGLSLSRRTPTPAPVMVSATVHPGTMWDLPRARPRMAHLVWAMLLATTIPWRNDVLYEGGADPVVIAKALISLSATGIAAVLVYRSRRSLYSVPATPILLLMAYFAVTVVGGLANNDFSAALVVAIRVSVLLAAVSLLVARYGPKEAVRCLIHVLAAITVAAALSGLTADVSRLGGVVPPLKPNALGFLVSVLAVWLLSKALSGRDSIVDVICLGLALTVLLLTGSRGSLVALVLAFVAMLFRATAIGRRTLITFVVAVPALVYLLLGTDVFSSVLFRGGDEQVTTLSNRTIAWEAALTMNRDVWQTWFGQGLAQKMVAVPGQWWDTQLLDSSWVSAFVQGGILGFALVAILAVTTVARAAFSPRREGALWLGLAVLAVVRGFLESGLFDSTTAFLVFCVTTMGARSSAAGFHQLATDDDQLDVPKAREAEPALVRGAI